MNFTCSFGIYGGKNIELFINILVTKDWFCKYMQFLLIYTLFLHFLYKIPDHAPGIQDRSKEVVIEGETNRRKYFTLRFWS